MSPKLLDRISGTARAIAAAKADIEREGTPIPESAVLLTKAHAHKYMSDYAKRDGEPGHVTRNIGDRALEALAVVKAERKLIATIRQALKEYDRYVKPDRRRGNGRKPVDPKAVAKGLKLMNSGMSIRRAATVTGTSFGTLWKAQRAKQMKLDV